MSGQVGWYVIKVAIPTSRRQIARKIDAHVRQLPAETKTDTEKAFVDGLREADWQHRR